MLKQLEVVFAPELNEYNNCVSVQLVLKDLRNQELPAAAARIPTWERLARMYTLLKRLAGPDGKIAAAPQELARLLGEGTGFVNVGLEIFAELGVVREENAAGARMLYFQAPGQKLNLQDSARFRESQKVAGED